MIKMTLNNARAAARKFIYKLYGKRDRDEAVISDKSDEVQDNKKHRSRQIYNLAVLLSVPIILTLMMLIYFNQNIVSDDSNITSKESNKKTSIHLASESFDPDKYWRNYQQEELHHQQEKFNQQIEELKEQQEEMIANVKNLLSKELYQTKEQLNLAKAELKDASLELKMSRSGDNKSLQPDFIPTAMGVNEISSELAFDVPKPASSYIPEGTYFTGHLPGGIVVSTGMNAPNENATPVIIRLVSRGNLAASNKLDISKCRIRGSAYGDLSSERAIIRLEKLICEVDGNYITSEITGQLYGSDGLNGIKGEVVSISEKHIRSAALGGILSGFSNSAKGQEGGALTGLGFVQTKKKGLKDMAKSGAMEGMSAAGEKIADFYLRQAERMSPVLIIPAGVRVNAQITEGFFVGSTCTHERVKNMREAK